MDISYRYKVLYAITDIFIDFCKLPEVEDDLHLVYLLVQCISQLSSNCLFSAAKKKTRIASPASVMCNSQPYGARYAVYCTGTVHGMRNGKTTTIRHMIPILNSCTNFQNLKMILSSSSSFFQQSEGKLFVQRCVRRITTYSTVAIRSSLQYKRS
jgi:hypothetical protein